METNLTLEQMKVEVANYLLQQINKTNGFISTLTERKGQAIGAEAIRLQDLVNLHTNHKIELEATDVDQMAQQRFDKQPNLNIIA